MPFSHKNLEIEGLILINSVKFGDDRGYFMETFKKSQFKTMGIDEDFQQDNLSVSNEHVIRGLHYQIDPKPQGKLVRVVRGAIHDVAVDIRKSSKTLGRWIKVELSAENGNMLWIPPGFAHGFLSLEDNTIVEYKTTNEYSKDDERSIVWNDPDLAIDWGIDTPLVSPKDMEAPLFKDAEIFP